MRVNNQTSLVRDIYTGKTFNRPLGGSAAVVNVGLNQTWLGSVCLSKQLRMPYNTF